jgi:Na+/phosphate symporter
MNVQLAKLYGVLIGALGIVGLFTSGHMFQFMNADIALDMLRIILAGILLYAGFATPSQRFINTALLGTGVLYVGMAIIGLATPTLGGLLPSGLTGFDIAFHLVTGALAIAASSRSHAGVAHHA